MRVTYHDFSAGLNFGSLKNTNIMQTEVPLHRNAHQFIAVRGNASTLATVL